MACPGCGERNVAKNIQAVGTSRMLAQSPAPKANVQVGSGAIDLPLELDGKVLVQYFGGKGLAKHTKRGPSSNRPYAVKHMDFLYVLPADAVDRISPGHPFQKVVKSGSAPVALPEYEHKSVEVVQAHAPEVGIRQPVARVIRTPIQEAEDLPDISKLPLKKLQLIDITPEQAVKLLAIEESGKHRSQVIVWLKNRIKND